MVQKVRRCIITIGGFGTRFLPATKAMPKEMLPIVDRPAIQYIVEEVVASGITEIMLITGRAKRAVEDHFDVSPELEHFLEQKQKTELLATIKNLSSMANFYFTRQDRPLGNGYAILAAKNFINEEPFAVMFADDIVVNKDRPALGQLLDVFAEKGQTVIALEKVALEQVSCYGVVGVAEQNERVVKISSLVEKPSIEEAPSNLAVVGKYVCTPSLMMELGRIKISENGEYELTEALKNLLQGEGLWGVELMGRRYDVGNKLGWLQANLELALEREDMREQVLALMRANLSD